MVKKYFFVALGCLALLIIGALIVYRTHISEKERIRKRFHNIASLISREERENPATSFMIMRSLTAYFHDPCTIEIGESSFHGEFSPDEIARNIIRMRTSFDRLTLSFHDLGITITGDDRARAVFTAELTGRYQGGDISRHVREVRVDLRKIEKRWVCERAETVEVLKR
jgi:hypothetical protein